MDVRSIFNSKTNDGNWWHNFDNKHSSIANIEAKYESKVCRVVLIMEYQRHTLFTNESLTTTKLLSLEAGERAWLSSFWIDHQTKQVEACVLIQRHRKLFIKKIKSTLLLAAYENWRNQEAVAVASSTHCCFASILRLSSFSPDNQNDDITIDIVSLTILMKLNHFSVLPRHSHAKQAH